MMSLPCNTPTRVRRLLPTPHAPWSFNYSDPWSVVRGPWAVGRGPWSVGPWAVVRGPVGRGGSWKLEAGTGSWKLELEAGSW